MTDTERAYKNGLLELTRQLQEAEARYEALRKASHLLAMNGLQSQLYDDDPNFRWAVDAVLSQAEAKEEE